jgi:hypothetical protein
MTTRRPAWFLLLTVLFVPACDEEVDPIDLEVDPFCEWLEERHCVLPWPSDHWLAPADTETGVRIEYDTASMPLNEQFAPFAVSEYYRFDGYSGSAPIMTTFGGAIDLTGLAGSDNFARSLEADSPTVLLNLATGERVAHSVEIDLRWDESVDEGDESPNVMVYLQGAQRLAGGTQFAVAFRNIQREDGTTVFPSPGFTVLRDATITSNPLIEERRPLYEAMFEGLTAAGVDRSELVQAWRFTTVSDSMIRRDLLHMRDDAMTRVPVGGGSCTVDEVNRAGDDEGAPREGIALRIQGMLEVPLYTDRNAPPTRVVRDAAGLPEFQDMAEVPYILVVPESVMEPGAEPARFFGYGHGLMGSRHEVDSGFVAQIASERQMVAAAVDWDGMSERDFVTVGLALQDVSTFARVGERLMQGVINQLVLTRSFTGACRTALAELQHPDGHSVIRDGEPYFIGISQGSIMGATTVAVGLDVHRAALMVGGMNYSVMIPRSSNWTTYEGILRAWYLSRLERELLLGIMNSHWDLASPDAFLTHYAGDLLPGTPEKTVLYQIARNDSQVPNRASDMAARTAGFPLLTPSSVAPWGIETTEAPEGSALVYFDFGVPANPPGNLVPPEDNNVHGDQRFLAATQEQVDRFLRDGGRIEHTCDGVCDPE